MNGRLDSQPRAIAVGSSAMKRGVIFAAALLCATALAAAPARPFHYSYKSKYAEFEFSWSSEAAAMPALARRFHAELARQKANTISGGKQEFALREKMGSPGVGWASVTKITTSGQSPRLLSLREESYQFTGGAHGNSGTTPLLWDRGLGKQIAFSALFPPRSNYAQILRRPYCVALDKERKKRRGGDGQVGGMFPEFDSCPKFSELAIAPGDSHRDGKFDQIHLIAGPYTAGPYSEGSYDIAVPVTRQLIATIEPGYRASFEPQRQ